MLNSIKYVKVYSRVMTKVIRITTNPSPMDLAEIDRLVEEGYARSRSDLVRYAIRDYIANHKKE